MTKKVAYIIGFNGVKITSEQKTGSKYEREIGVLLRKAIKASETEIITTAGDSLPVYYK